MSKLPISLLGVPMQAGTKVKGCLMGPDAYRCAGLAETLRDLGYEVVDRGNVAPKASRAVTHSNPSIHALPQVVGWIEGLQTASYEIVRAGEMPVFMGGDHALAAGTVPGVARALSEEETPLFVLWLDAHPDLNDLDTTDSGNLHGTPMAYLTGQPGFEGVFPALQVEVPPENVCMMGLRSVDPSEREVLRDGSFIVHDMRSLDENGVVAPLRAFLEKVEGVGGRIYVSLDVDFLDPSIAPAVGTTVPGGATFREAHLIMEMLCDSGLVCALDLVELNPYLDERGRTARLMVDLAASMMGRTVLDRPTRITA